jgi:hypothetical protein
MVAAGPEPNWALKYAEKGVGSGFGKQAPQDDGVFLGAPSKERYEERNRSQYA